MADGISWALLVALAALLIAAAVCDLRKREIPHAIVIAVALLAPGFWWTTGLALYPDVAIQLGVALLVFGLFAIAFTFGWMGGGDVKLLSALVLWLPSGAVLALLVIMSFAGGVLTLATWASHRIRKLSGAVEVPYGVAIAFAGLWLIGQRFLNQFG
jgi:prepilin peptidase CpaA